MLRKTFKTSLSPNVFRQGQSRFFFSLGEKPYPHVHVSHSDGEAKFWISPTFNLARIIGLISPRIKEAERLVQTREPEFIDAWGNHCTT